VLRASGRAKVQHRIGHFPLGRSNVALLQSCRRGRTATSCSPSEHQASWLASINHGEHQAASSKAPGTKRQGTKHQA